MTFDPLKPESYGWTTQQLPSQLLGEGPGESDGGGIESVNGDPGPLVVLTAEDLGAADESHNHSGVYANSSHLHSGMGLYPAAGYGGISLSGDPMFYQVPGSFGSNTVIFCRMFIPAGAVITGAWFGLRGTSSHDGINSGNKISVFDDTGANPVSTAVDDSMWTTGGWRGANLTAPISAQGSDRFVYALALVKGMPSGAGFLNPSGANDSNAGTIAIGPSQAKRRAGYWNGQSSMPASFDPTTIGTASGFASLCLLT